MVKMEQIGYSVLAAANGFTKTVFTFDAAYLKPVFMFLLVLFFVAIIFVSDGHLTFSFS